MKLAEMAKKNDAGEWVCLKCDAVLGEGAHAKVLAHYNNHHPDLIQKKDQGPKCDHDWRLLKKSDGKGKGAYFLKQGYEYYCPKCHNIAKPEEVDL